MVYVEAEILEPQAVYKIVYVPGVVIAVVVVLILDRRYYALLFVISYQVRGYSEYSGHIADFILQFS